MLLSIQQKYILTALRELGCLQKRQLQAMMQGRFDWAEPEMAQRRIEAMFRQMRCGIGEFHSDAEFVWLGSTQPDARRLEAVDVMLELSENHPKDFSAKCQCSDRQAFFDLNFNELDRDLTAEERQEWNSIYASYRGRSALTGKIIGVDPLSISVRDRQTGHVERQTMYCAVVVPYWVRIVIPASEMWESGQERPDFVLQNMVGATIDFIVIKVDRESGFAVASRRMAARSQRYYFSRRPSLHRDGARATCRVLSVGPRRCLVECFGHDVNLTQRDLRYTAIPDLRDAYHPGEELDCIVKSYDAGSTALRISVKETESNPFEGAELRHPVGSRRQASIAGKYGGGVFCNLPDGTVCMCSYSYQHEDADFTVGDTVILVVQRYDAEKRQMYGKILSKW
ncbi:MAG: hypothetical protein K2O45_04755 [Oscillospiraceae bacterium]|nr:hypothetical protein [Oscillospiraceae bacterium]